MQSAAARLAVTVSAGEIPNCECLSILIDDLRSSMAMAESVPDSHRDRAGDSQSHQQEQETETDSTTLAATADFTEVQEAMSELGQFLPAEYLQQVAVRRRVAMATTSAASGAAPFPLRESPLWLSPSSRESSYPTPSPPISVHPDPTPP